MKRLILLLLLICSISALQATDYYIDNSVTDTNVGSATPDFTTYNPATFATTGGSASVYNSLADINTKTKTAGDRVYFRKGQTWYGSITIGQSGTAGNIITYGSFGSGANPIITGFTTVTGWANLGGNIWESSVITDGLTACNIVTIGGVNTPMGRTPNIGSLYTTQTHNANLSITSTNLTGTPNWTGAQVVIRKEFWIWQTGTITSQSGSTISYTDGGFYTPKNNTGFFIQNDARTLDVQNEWYYNPTTKKLRIYSIAQPVNVKVPTVADCINTYLKNYITLDGLSIVGYNNIGIFFNTATNILITNCTVNKIGFEGISFNASQNYTIDNNVIKNANYGGIAAWSGTNVNEVITNNTIDSAFTIVGAGRGVESAAGIAASCDNTLIQYNKVSNTGYHGIIVSAQSGQVRNNFVDKALMNLTDGGGIYSYGPMTNLIIDGNVVINTIGNSAGASSNVLDGVGIYLDNTSENVTVSNNTVYKCAIGLSASGANHINFLNNVSCDHLSDCIFLYNFFNVAGSMNNIVMTGNTFVQRTATSYPAHFQSFFSNNLELFFSSSNNNIFARPISDANTMNYYQPGAPGHIKTLVEWQAFGGLGLDANSTKSPKAVTLESEVMFAYNETKNPKVVTIPNIGMGMDGVTRYGNSFTLQPYTSVVVLKDIINVGGSNKQLKTNTGQPLKTSGGLPIFVN